MTQTGALMPGEMLGDDYRIEKAIGSGGFGITYLATETTLDRKVCIKEYFPTDFAARNGLGEAVPRSEGCSADYDWGLERFIEEARALARFDHPNIVKVFRYFQENCTAYMVLQFEEGQSLKDWSKSLGRSPRQDEIDAILNPLLEALATLHADEFLHRDIAPDNIIIRPDNTPVLIDFGSARGEIARQSRTVSALVKPGYSPYEQYGNDGSQQGAWSDIYALGATLYQLVTGKRPPDAPSRIVKDELVGSVERALGSYRPEFLMAIDWALKLDIDTRPQSITEWRTKLFTDQKAARPAPSVPGATVPVQSPVPIPKAPVFANRQARAPANPPPPAKEDGPQPGLMSMLGRRRKTPEPSAAAKTAVGLEPAILKPVAEPVAAILHPSPDGSEKRAGWGRFGWGRKNENNPTPVPGAPAASDRVETAAIAAALAERAQAQALVPAPPQPARRRALIPSFPKLKPVRASARKPVENAVVDRRPARPRRRRTGGWSRHIFRAAAAVVFAGGIVYLQNSLPEYTVRGSTVATSSGGAPSSFLKRQFRPHDGKAQHVRYGNGGSWLVTTGGDETLKIWNTSWGSLIRTLELDHGRATALAVRGRTAVTGHEAGDIAVWDLDDGRKLAHFKRNEARIWSVILASDGIVLAASHDWTVTLWKTTAPERPHHIFEGHDSAVQAIAYDQQSGTIVSASADKTLRIWDRARLSHRRTLSGHKDFVTSVTFSPDGGRIVSGDLSGEVRIWRTSNGSRVRRIRAHEGEVNRVWFVADDVVATSSVDGRLRFFSTRSGKSLQTFGSRGRPVTDMAVSTSRKRIATVTENGWVRIWDAAILMQ